MTRNEILNKICPTACTNINACTFLGCTQCDMKLNEWLDEYDKHIIEQYKADTRIKDKIREIHDNVAQEMYCKGIDDMVGNLIANSRTESIDGKLMLIVTEERIKTVANEMKKRLDS